MSAKHAGWRMFAMRKKRLALTVAGMIAVLLVAVGSRTVVAAQEVCTTPPMRFNVGEFINCDFTNAYAYGPVTVNVAIIEGFSGTIVFSTSFTVLPLHTVSLGGPASSAGPWNCRYEVTALFTGLGRGVIQRTTATDTIVGPTAVCNPF